MRPRTVVLGVALIVLAGCGGDGLKAVTHSGVTALIEGRTEGGMTAEVVGKLVVGQGGCLALATPDTAKPLPIVWPAGSKLAADGQSIEAGRSFRVGEQIRAGGGELSPPPQDPARPPACLSGIDTLVVISPEP
jgi:hypothetical protein